MSFFFPGSVLLPDTSVIPHYRWTNLNALAWVTIPFVVWLLVFSYWTPSGMLSPNPEEVFGSPNRPPESCLLMPWLNRPLQRKLRLLLVPRWFILWRSHTWHHLSSSLFCAVTLFHVYVSLYLVVGSSRGGTSVFFCLVSAWHKAGIQWIMRKRTRASPFVDQWIVECSTTFSLAFCCFGACLVLSHSNRVKDMIAYLLPFVSLSQISCTWLFSAFFHICFQRNLALS